MPEKKVVFILPGFGAKPGRPEYREVGRFYEQKGIEPLFVEVEWDKRRPFAPFEKFLKQYFATDADTKYLFGFSVGAQMGFHLAALDSTPIHGPRPAHLLLCSPSSYYREDLDELQRVKGRPLPELWTKDIERFSWSDMMRQIKSPISLVIGEDEPLEPFRKVAYERIQRTLDELKTPKELEVIPGVGHNLADPRYLATVERIVAKL